MANATKRVFACYNVNPAGGGEGGFRCSLRQCSMMLGLAWTLVIIASKRTIRTTMIVLQDIEVCKEDCIVDLAPPTSRSSLLAPKAKCLSVSASLSQLSTLLCLLLAALPRLFPVDVTLSAAFCLHGLSLYADAFIPEGGHRLLDVTSSVEGSTQCDLDESKLRAFLSQDILSTIEIETHDIPDARTYLLTLKEIRVKRGLTDDLGAEALMIDALDKVEKDLKKPLLRNDKKGMDLLLAEFDKINKK
ncbi:hypothetical protein JHK86_010725 [Glycine max]|nr:hypothetical protein JHK86_010725 [Glycine max]